LAPVLQRRSWRIALPVPGLLGYVAERTYRRGHEMGSGERGL
jgi:hypothetical protein